MVLATSLDNRGTSRSVASLVSNKEKLQNTSWDQILGDFCGLSYFSLGTWKWWEHSWLYPYEKESCPKSLKPLVLSTDVFPQPLSTIGHDTRKYELIQKQWPPRWEFPTLSMLRTSPKWWIKQSIAARCMATLYPKDTNHTKETLSPKMAYYRDHFLIHESKYMPHSGHEAIGQVRVSSYHITT